MTGEWATVFIETTTLKFRFLIITFNAFVVRAASFLHPYDTHQKWRERILFGAMIKKDLVFNCSLQPTSTTTRTRTRSIETTCQRGQRLHSIETLPGLTKEVITTAIIEKRRKCKLHAELRSCFSM